MATQLSEKELEKLKNMFISLDVNGDGRLSRQEILKGLAGKENEKELIEIMRAMDTDGSGYIDYNGKQLFVLFVT